MMNDFYRYLQVKLVKKHEYLSFTLRSFYLFKNSKHGNVLLFGSPRLLAPLAVFLYLLAVEIHLFRARRFFIKFDDHTLAQFALTEKHDSLFISNIAVANAYRRLGIATHILNLIENIAAALGKYWLELSVLQANAPAQRLYLKFGFTKKEKRRWTFILIKSLKAS